MAKTAIKIVQKKKVNHYSKEECHQEIARLKNENQQESHYFGTVVKQYTKLGGC